MGFPLQFLFHLLHPALSLSLCWDFQEKVKDACSCPKRKLKLRALDGPEQAWGQPSGVQEEGLRFPRQGNRQITLRQSRAVGLDNWDVEAFVALFGQENSSPGLPWV